MIPITFLCLPILCDSIAYFLSFFPTHFLCYFLCLTHTWAAWPGRRSEAFVKLDCVHFFCFAYYYFIPLG